MADLDSSILLAFLEADGEPVSGDRLAKELGVSRVAIWSRLERLRASGYVFAASTRKGYALRSVPRHLDPALLDAHLRRLKVTPKVEFLAEVDSTNSEAERRLAVGQEAPFAVLARTQKAGRGRLGRKWHSAPSGNLYLSLAFRPFIPPDRLKPFTLWMGLALCAHVEKSLGLKLGLKWPNDLQAPDGRKVAGMLTEARLDADSVRELVFGVGLNLTGAPKDFPADLRASAGSLEAALGAPLDLNREAAGVIAALFRAWEQFEEGTWSRSFRKLWSHHDVLAGKSVRVGLRGDPIAGVVDGIDDEGSLILRTGGGRRAIVSSGEVTLRKP
ncbi:MAG: biotin--[acetyl-CoA-carboxylase] ligase [Opitutales bacterium]|jgi:BirA family transcriptional regulator, biotin operon repressor / biotin---[acetyl-CoA-carboxylase] ligase|nr:biotin--[acetyl-CoA-carboxylase] ligase [Opitutales bacterium]MDP4657862.1 biotin--[acetyl-CoA-carboxylase] ligase [Opitutales bacterium]MDP4774621.1 biotin--[acetyl-CoA-carboxylase] ligase [Opitutales bacterium]MDP4786709.1 biotin--[acetyl-CoA-carboxylase] ligase [Opitutales bacterium]MDP4860194.1 biotin--[acetyl-CoA-carboxylase] ligase [Opitutales bacterium]